MKFFTSTLAIALAAVAFAAPAHAAGNNWSAVGVWGGSSDVTVLHAQGGTEGGVLTLVGGSDKVTVTGIQDNGSKFNLQGTAVLESEKVNITTYQAGKNNIAGTLAYDSSKVSVSTQQVSSDNLSVVGVFGSDDVDVTVIQGPLTITASPL